MNAGDDRDALARKYDVIAERYSVGRYAAPDAVARYFVRLVRGWGGPARAGATVLEIGCADGFTTEALARSGFRVHAVDLSPRMIAVARERLRDAGLRAEVSVADLNAFEPPGRFDVVLGCMESFFRYAHDPAAVLEQLWGICDQKLIVDANPREVDVGRALDDVLAAGFRHAEARPRAVPQRVRLGAAGGRALEIALRLPLVGSAVLRRKLNVALLGVR